MAELMRITSNAIPGRYFGTEVERPQVIESTRVRLIWPESFMWKGRHPAEQEDPKRFILNGGCHKETTLQRVVKAVERTKGWIDPSW
jgi:hypothetical protein